MAKLPCYAFNFRNDPRIQDACATNFKILSKQERNLAAHLYDTPLKVVPKSNAMINF